MRHRFHSLCPYFAMFPESFAEQWISRLTQVGDVVLDPFCGRGTTPFQSLLMGRRALGNDINPVAYCLARAKTNAPRPDRLLARLTVLERGYRRVRHREVSPVSSEFFQYAYAAETLQQLLFLRGLLRWRLSDVDCMLAALTLGALHGESTKSPSYLSNQMPRTISTKPAYSVRFWRRHRLRAPERDVFAVLRNAVAFRYQSDPPSGRGEVLLGDMRDLPNVAKRYRGQVACVVTSPPYLSVTRYEEDQWLRLWFLGGASYPTYGVVSRDDRHEGTTGYWRMIGDFWRCMGFLCASGAHVVLRVGAGRMDPRQIVDGIVGTSVLARRRVRLVHSGISAIRKRQTDSFRPGSAGCKVEVDCHLEVR